MNFIRNLYRYRFRFGYRWSVALKLAKGEL